MKSYLWKGIIHTFVLILSTIGLLVSWRDSIVNQTIFIVFKKYCLFPFYILTNLQIFMIYFYFYDNPFLHIPRSNNFYYRFYPLAHLINSQSLQLIVFAL